MPPSFRCSLLLALSLLFPLAAAQAQPSLATGVSVPGFAGQPEAARTSLLHAAGENRVRNLRLTLTPPIDATLAAMAEIHQHGIGILLEVPLGLPRYYPPGTQPRPGAPRIAPARPLSALDPVLFEQSFQKFLEAADTRGIKFVGIEIGDKINWPNFNGDFRVGQPGLTGSAADNPAEMTDVRMGFARYVAIVAAARRARDGIANYRAVPLISASLMRVPTPMAKALDADQLDEAATLKALHVLGLERFIDGVGIQFYPGTRVEPIDAAHNLQTILAACTAAKPCWLTEWNLPAGTDSCDFPPQQIKTTAVLREMIQHAAATGSVAGAFWFDWNDGAVAIFKCGTFLPAN